MYFKNKSQTLLDNKTSPDLALGYDLTYPSLGSTCTELLSVYWPQAWHDLWELPSAIPSRRNALPSDFQRLNSSDFSDIRSKVTSDRSFPTTASEVVFSQSLPQLPTLFPSLHLMILWNYFYFLCLIRLSLSHQNWSSRRAETSHLVYCCILNACNNIWHTNQVLNI